MLRIWLHSIIPYLQDQQPEPLCHKSGQSACKLVFLMAATAARCLCVPAGCRFGPPPRNPARVSAHRAIVSGLPGSSSWQDLKVCRQRRSLLSTYPFRESGRYMAVTFVSSDGLLSERSPSLFMLAGFWA